MDAQDVLRDMNAALEASTVYDQQYTTPDWMVISHEAYMIMTGHTKVKIGRRKFVWR
jgi:hypothetical protein